MVSYKAEFEKLKKELENKKRYISSVDQIKEQLSNTQLELSNAKLEIKRLKYNLNELQLSLHTEEDNNDVITMNIQEDNVGYCTDLNCGHKCSFCISENKFANECYIFSTDTVFDKNGNKLRKKQILNNSWKKDIFFNVKIYYDCSDEIMIDVGKYLEKKYTGINSCPKTIGEYNHIEDLCYKFVETSLKERKYI